MPKKEKVEMSEEEEVFNNENEEFNRKQSIKNSRSAKIVNPRTGIIKTNSKGSELRSFMCVSINGKEFESRAQKSSPNLAAGSMFSQWVKTQKEANKINGIVILRESTRGSLQKDYKYNVTRTKLDTPVEKAKGIFVKYDTQIISQK